MLAAFMVGCDGTKDNGVLADLPGPDTVDHVEVPPALPDDVRSSTAESRPAALAHADWMPAADLSDRWAAIIIHHTATEAGSLELIDQQHRQRGWQDGCGHHFVIGNGTGSRDGEVEMSPRWRHQVVGAPCPSLSDLAAPSASGFREDAISIVLVGDLDEHGLGLDQMESLVELVGFLMKQCQIPASRVLKHSDLGDTSCPGRYFSLWDLKRRLDSR